MNKAIQAHFNCESKVSVLNFSCAFSGTFAFNPLSSSASKTNLFGQSVVFTNGIDNKRIHTIPRKFLKNEIKRKIQSVNQNRNTFSLSVNATQRICLVELFGTRLSFPIDFFFWINTFCIHGMWISYHWRWVV